jgi:hypothetical protein
MKRFLLLFSVLFTCWQINAQYCTPAVLPTGCTVGDTIDDFIITGAGFSHLGTGCSADNYGDFTGDATLEISLQQSVTYDFEINHGFGNQQVKIWIDFNVDQVFDASEVVYTSPGNGNPTVGSFSIPLTSQLGLTRMRVINIYFAEPLDPCSPGGTFGETHDYTVSITPPPSCPAPTSFALASVQTQSADFTWDEVPNASNGYNWELYLDGEDPSSATPAFSGNQPFGTNTLSLTTLQSGTDYDFYITSDCDTDGLSTTIGPVSFSTLFLPPPNDNICDAIPLTVGVIPPGDTYTNFASTEEINEPEGSCFNGGINGSVWFTFVSPASGEVEVSTDITGASLVDTEVAVYDAPTDCTDPLTMGGEVGCDQDGGLVVFNNSIINLTGLTAGATYYV